MTQTPTHQSTTPVPREAESNDIFTDPAIANAKLEDPLAEFLSKHWQQVIMTGLVIGMIAYFYNGYVTSTRENQMRASELFTKARTSYEELEKLASELDKTPIATEAEKADEAKRLRTEKEKQITEARERLSQQLKALSDSPFPYNQMAVLYQAEQTIKSGDLTAARTQLKSLPSWDSISDKSSPERLLSEQASLMLAKGLLDNEASLAEGRTLLKELAEGAAFVAPQAGVALARSATTANERQEALAVLESLTKALPQQMDLVREDLERLR